MAKAKWQDEGLGLLAFLALGGGAASSTATPQSSASCTTDRVSIGDQGQQGDLQAHAVPQAGVSADGRWVPFFTASKNLVPGDTTSFSDVFLRDRNLATTELISVALSGAPGNNSSAGGTLTPDARFVVFGSTATDLVPGDTNFKTDTFIRDRVLLQTYNIHVNSAGVQANNHSNGSHGVSADGRFVIFSSTATNLIPNDSNGSTLDVFLHDRQTGETSVVSVDSQGVQATTGSTQGSISADGRYIAFATSRPLSPMDTNPWSDLYIHDRITKITTLATLTYLNEASTGGGGPGWISADGRKLVFESGARDLVPDDNNEKTDIFVRDLVANTTIRASVALDGTEANEQSNESCISADSRVVAFTTRSTNLVSAPTNGSDHVFLKDLLTGEVRVASLSTTGVENTGISIFTSLSADGQIVSWETSSGVLVPGDTNGVGDAFARDCQPLRPSLWCTAQLNAQGCPASLSYSGLPSASAGSGFLIRASSILNHTPGLLFYGTSGKDFLPFLGGTLCALPPLRRTLVLDSGGSAPPTIDCSGVLELDFNAWIAAGNDPTLVPLVQVQAQIWSRDMHLPAPSVVLSNALEFTIGP